MEAGDVPLLHVKEQTFWMRERLRPFVNIRVETWVEHIGTSTVAIGHKMVDPSRGAVIAVAKVLVAIVATDGSAEVIPDQPRLQALTDTDPDCQDRIHDLYEDISRTTSLHEAPFQARPFVIGPGDCNDMGQIDAACFIHWLEQARFEEVHARLGGQVGLGNLPGIKQVGVVHVNQPTLGAEVTVKLWPASGRPGSCLVEMRDVSRRKVFCRAVVDGLPSQNLPAAAKSRL